MSTKKCIYQSWWTKALSFTLHTENLGLPYLVFPMQALTKAVKRGWGKSGRDFSSG